MKALLALVFALVASRASALEPADLASLLDAASADARLRERGDCNEADLARVRRGVDVLARLVGGPGADAPAPRWRFPVTRVTAGGSIGGRNGDGYRVAKRGACYAWKNPGHPAHDLFVPDPDQDWRDERGASWDALAVEDGIVALTHEGWKPGDLLKGGNSVVLYLPARRQLAYYAHLDTIAVKPGERVARGAVLGTIGRTGLNAWPKRSPTHLHFALWDAKTLVPVNPYSLLAGAE